MGKARLDEERQGFDKWQMYKLVQDEPIGPCIVPKTAPLTVYNLHTFVRKYHRVYVKPRGSWGGSNISLVEGTPRSALWTIQGRQATTAELNEIVKHYQGVPAIVQQAIPAIRYEDCPCDIRVHLQRDIDGAWVYAGELVKIGGNGIVANVEISQGKVLPFLTVIRELFPRGGTGEDDWKCRLNEIGTGICRLFDEYAHIEEVGIDLALDNNQQLWLIEVNTNDALGGPSHELFRALPDLTVYNQLQQRAKERSLGMIAFFFDLLEEDDRSANDS